MVRPFIPPDDDKDLISPKILVNSMKGTLTCLEKDKDRFFEATDIALIPPRLMPI